MSGFSSQDVFGPASTIMPGNAVSMQAPGNLGISGPGIESIQWGPTGLGEQQIAGLYRFTQGGIAPDSVVYAKFPSNDFITAKYTVKPWTEDKSHLYIREGMLVFGMAQMDAQFRDLCNMAALPKLNELLAQQHNIFEQYADRYSELRKYKEALETRSEKQIEGELFKRRNQPNVERASDMDLVIQSLNASVVRYQTAAGIMATWNFLGCVRTVSEPTTGNDIFTGDGTDRVASYTVTIAKYCQVSNIWGTEEFGENVNVGSRLYLVLKRRELPSGKFGAFYLMPYATRFYPKPPKALCAYQNPYTGEWEQGKVIYVGQVTRMGDREGTRMLRETAAGIGINSDVRAAYEANASLEYLEVQLGI